jgi:GNAT superfamily N-acetyltransferase
MSAALHCAARADWVAIMEEIRPAAAMDAAGIATVQTEVWRDAYAGLLPADFLARRVITTDIWLNRIMKLGAQFAVQVAVDDTGTVVGFALTGPAVGPAASEDESVGQLYAIYVLAAYWGTGIGYDLHRAAIDDLRAEGFSEAILWVLPGNARAIAFYERQGWSDRGIETDDDFDGVCVTERLYGRRL